MSLSPRVFTMRYLLVVVGGFAFTSLASAQQYPTQPFPGNGGGGGYGSGGFLPGAGPAVNQNNTMPNIYNPQTQPLSPYLNLLRGGNTAANYYYGVRPGTVGAGGRGSGGAPFTAAGGNRTLFFPQLASAPDPLGSTLNGPDDVLPPAGHSVVYNNTLGFFPSPFGQAGGTRTGLSGVGTQRPAGRR